MTRLTRLCRTVGVGLAVAAATLSMTQAADAAPKTPQPDVPANLVPDAGNKVFLIAHATGVQIYKCTDATTGPAWTLLAPEANLVGNNDKNVIVKHSAGPTWTATDGSTATKDPLTANKSEPGAAGAIPWLLIKTNAAAGPNGDRLARTTFIQRINTVGGLAPTSGCSASTLGTESRVGYEADYVFWQATGGA